jgi:hypothetical protein
VKPLNEKPPNENGRTYGRPAARQNNTPSSEVRYPRNRQGFKPDSNDEEQYRNSAICFQNLDKTEDWHADYCGVLVAEDCRQA